MGAIHGLKDCKKSDFNFKIEQLLAVLFVIKKNATIKFVASLDYYFRLEYYCKEVKYD